MIRLLGVLMRIHLYQDERLCQTLKATDGNITPFRWKGLASLFMPL
jgi:hypothetical protein